MHVCGFTHRSGFAPHVLFLLMHLAVRQALVRGAYVKKVVVAVQTTIATGPTVMNRLVTKKTRQKKKIKQEQMKRLFPGTERTLHLQ